MNKKPVIICLIFMLMSLVGCTPKLTTVLTTETSAQLQKTNPKEKPELIIAAAASVIDAFTEIGAAFEETNDCKITFSTGSTGTLVEQITNGAPFDLFVAANESAITGLDEKGSMMTDTIKLYATGRVGIATLKDGDVKAWTLEDLVHPAVKVIAIASPEHAPYGLAAKQAIETAGLWTTLEPKIVYGKSTAEVLSYLTTGNAEVAFMALSQNDEATMHFNLLDASTHDPLNQAMAILKDTQNEALARSFIEYVNGPEGNEILSKYGFVTPEALAYE